MIVLQSSENRPWPWAERGDQAEEVFRREYSSLFGHLKPFESQLRKRQDKGRHWWELRSCAYYQAFIQPKIVYQEIQFHPCYALDDAGRFANNKVFLLSRNDRFLLAVLNSSLIWWHNWRYLPHMKDEALSPAAFRMENLPIAAPSDQHREQLGDLSAKAMNIATVRRHAVSDLLDWLRLEHGVETPTLRLQDPSDLTSDDFLAEIKKSLGKGRHLSPSAVRSLRQAYDDLVSPVRNCTARLGEIERRISDLVNAVYGLTPEEVTLMWQTAPPRMPHVSE
ncbi:MAG TPA: TaqI-like C-terminal specificity domain-containing protein [Acidobacteriota bacterium]|nr:TaqI-like C-terminal specificity domain-containing protein [Acidobacteriota bacterium]